MKSWSPNKVPDSLVIPYSPDTLEPSPTPKPRIGFSCATVAAIDRVRVLQSPGHLFCRPKAHPRREWLDYGSNRMAKWAHSSPPRFSTETSAFVVLRQTIPIHGPGLQASMSPYSSSGLLECSCFRDLIMLTCRRPGASVLRRPCIPKRNNFV